MRRAVLGVGVGLGTLLFGVPVSAAFAQEDFRNLDRGRPLRTEDAFPIPLHEWEVEAGLRGHLVDADDASSAGGVVELKTGPVLNLELGVELGGAFTAPGDASAGIEAVEAHVLYGVSRETRSWPAFGLRAELASPGFGDAGAQEWGAAVDGLLTRSLGRLRLHGNVGRQFVDQVDGPDAWRIGLAADYPIGLFSRAIMADVHATLPDDGGSADVWLEVGTRWQITNTTVLDFGLGTRLDQLFDGQANIELGIGFSYAFGLAGLVPVPPYPEPRID